MGLTAADVRRSPTPPSIARGRAFTRPGGKQEILEEEGCKVVSPGEPRFSVDGPRLLPRGRLGDPPGGGDLLVTQPLQEEESDLLLGGGQPPSLELATEGGPEPLEQVARLAPPADSLGLLGREPQRKLGCFLPRDSGRSHDRDEVSRKEESGEERHQHHGGFRGRVPDRRSLAQIEREVEHREHGHSPERRDRGGEEPSFGCESMRFQELDPVDATDAGWPGAPASVTFVPASTERTPNMDALLFHPKLVHVPLALGVLMPLISGALLLAWWRGWLPRRVWVLAVALQAVLVGSGLLALRTGEAEADRVERVVAEPIIEAHEEAAEVFVWAGGAVLALMIGAGALARHAVGLPTAAAATLGTVLVLALGYRTGEAGGSLVYRHGAAQAYANGAVPMHEPSDDAAGDDD